MAYWWLNQNEDEIEFWDEELIVVPRRDKLGKTAPGFTIAAGMHPGDLGFAFVGGGPSPALWGYDEQAAPVRTPAREKISSRINPGRIAEVRRAPGPAAPRTAGVRSRAPCRRHRSPPLATS